jgi:hypothetical protein
MNKKGLSVVTASVLLISLALVLATVIYNQMRQQIVSLSPEVDCLGVDFRAEIVYEANGAYLNVVNLGNLPIVGFYIKTFVDGESEVYEDVSFHVEPGRTEKIFLARDYLSGEYFVVPKVEGDDLNEQSFVGVCKDLYGIEISV